MEYIKAKTIVTNKKNGSQWFGADYNMNIYKGCSHGCIYCDSRSSCYGIENFDIVKPKENALEIIRNDLRRKVKKGVIGMGAMSDPYNPLEKELLLTRHALELIYAYDFGVTVATKSTLLERDIDMLNLIKEQAPVLCKITITASDDNLSKKIEPNVSVSSERFELIRKLSENDIFSGILLMPVLPFIEDNEENIISIVNKAHEVGARFIYPAFGMTLRQNQREYYFKKLNELFPNENLCDKYIKRFGSYYICQSPDLKKLWSVFTEKCKEYGILYNMKEIINGYKKRYKMSQLTLFDME
ncbi:MAG: radical SAM protein [Clostridia bacterium]|nr:radical SAM protein [Clostridia bacterium]